jgi:hypothetical protein
MRMEHMVNWIKGLKKTDKEYKSKVKRATVNSRIVGNKQNKLFDSLMIHYHKLHHDDHKDF